MRKNSAIAVIRNCTIAFKNSPYLMSTPSTGTTSRLEKFTPAVM